MIGDHLQLRAPVNSYDLEVRHNFGISMFERLINNRVPHEMLHAQKRMRRELRELLQIVEPRYDSLFDHTNTIQNIQPLQSVRSSLYFIDHEYKEDSRGSQNQSSSYSNTQEAEIVKNLVDWLIKEVNPSDITVITGYVGQKKIISKLVPPAVKVSTVDRYQGDENQVIILSLVRSNDLKKIGFIGIRNRVVVMTSRAKRAFFIVGNSKHLLESNSAGTTSTEEKNLSSENNSGKNLWANIISYLQKSKCIGNFLARSCSDHPYIKINPFSSNTNPSDKNPSSCTASCGKKFDDCVHICRSFCHRGSPHPPCQSIVMKESSTCSHKIPTICFLKYENKSPLLRCDELIERPDCSHKASCWAVTSETECEMCQKALQESIKKKKEEIRKEIERIQNLPISDAPQRRKLDKNDPEFISVKDRVEKYIVPAHGIRLFVTEIKKIDNEKLSFEFLKQREQLFNPLSEPQLLFHGTTTDNINSIAFEGFKLSQKSNNLFGKGIYFATDSSKSAQLIYTKGSYKLLLCKVALGSTFTINNLVEKDQYYNWEKKNLDEIGKDSIFGIRNGVVMYDEYVVYHPHQALPMYEISFKEVKLDCPEIPLHGINNDIITLKDFSSQAANPNIMINYKNPEQYHYMTAYIFFTRLDANKRFQISKIERCYSSFLTEIYNKEKKEIERSGKILEELLVCHATGKRDNIENIAKDGFKVGGKDGIGITNGAAHGTGIYFGLNPDISSGYARSTQQMLLAHVIANDFVYKDQNMIVIGKKERTLPQYVIHYR
eukprot:c21816_g1_i3.p1 GENE.c21816_g1_i3~~c21816_g1_i3.p1  ORF type:complete len:776 (+),score=152.05 c21816_g1_i3:307-2634(+)